MINLSDHKISISNIAWPHDCDDEALLVAKSAGFSGIELAPAKVLGHWESITEGKAKKYKDKLNKLGLSIPAFQGILFGKQECELFVSNITRRNLSHHLIFLAKLANVMGAKALVFGAPTLRDPGELTDNDAQNIAIDFFRNVGEKIKDYDVKICFEANPSVYNCKFITHTEQAISLIKRINHPNIRLQIDLGTIFQNNEDPIILTEAANYAAHFHISEPSLLPIGNSGCPHLSTGNYSRNSSYKYWKSIEMKTDENWKSNITKSAEIVSSFYL